MTADTFPSHPGQLPIVAVHDQVENVVLFNDTYSGDAVLEHRALFMDRDNTEPVMRLPIGYLLG